MPPTIKRFDLINLDLNDIRINRGVVDTAEWHYMNIRSFFVSAFRNSITCDEILKFYKNHSIAQFYNNSSYILLHINFDSMNSLILNLSNFRQSVLQYTSNKKFHSAIDIVWPRLAEARDSLVHAHDRNFGFSGFQSKRIPINGIEFGQMKKVLGSSIELMDKIGSVFALDVNSTSFHMLLDRIEQQQ